LLDLTLEDDLRIEFTLAFFNATVERVPELINDPRTLIALSDGGAHVDMLCDAGYCTYLLGTWVRERQAMTLEHAIHRITAQPADLFGIKGRGRLKVGNFADVVVFDPETIGSPTGRSASSTCRAAASAWSCRRAASRPRSSTAR